MPRPSDRVPEPDLLLSPKAAESIREHLPEVADDVIGRVVAEVPAYAGAFSGPMGDNIRTAVHVALEGFVSMVSGSDTAPLQARAGALEGAYQLGRGEARSGRTTDALLSAYRIGSRTAWQHLSARAVALGVDATTVAAFAGLVFAWIDELSAASVAGHRDEEETTGRARQRLLEELAQALLDGASEPELAAAVEHADWRPPTTLTAVIAPSSQVAPLLQLLPAATLEAADQPGLDGAGLLLVPDADGSARRALLDLLRHRGCHVGPARPWALARESYARALRARGLGLEGDSDQHLVELVRRADPAALADLRAQVLAPLDGLRPMAAAKLTETLRAWLLHQGRREDIAAALFVHPQTVRYRVTQLRELFGERLQDPATVMALTIALGSQEDSS
ncbi:MAG: helix-turn-helix domain-containing protein [Nocardioidaceae bacterium]|nr:helix-turn-helix domain-containing protein [Nocardioidaceae bacterium]MCL2613959.1 helix-turn-helix domain-containing protein [Nocardioidaceae bacterium]